MNMSIETTNMIHSHQHAFNLFLGDFISNVWSSVGVKLLNYFPDHELNCHDPYNGIGNNLSSLPLFRQAINSALSMLLLFYIV